MQTLLRAAVVSLLMLCFATPRAFAEKVGLYLPGRYMMRDHLSPDPPILAANTANFFVLRKGVLAKYDAATRQQAGVLELFGKPDAAPTDWLFDDQASAIAFRDKRAKRLAPARMTASDTDIQILVGDQYFRVDPATMTLTLNTTIVADGVPPTSTDQYIYSANHPLVSNDTVSYRVIIPPWPNQDVPIHLLAFDRATGATLGTAMLPAAMQGRITWEAASKEKSLKEIYRLVQQVPVTVAPSKESLFIYRQGILAQYDINTLQLRNTLSLYGVLPVLANPQQATDDEKMAINIARARRLMPAMLTVIGTHVNILVGDDYFSVDSGDLTIIKQGQVVNTDEGDLRDRIDYLAVRGQPVLTAIGEIFYLVDGQQIFSINCDSGEVKTKDLPALLARTLQPEPKAGGNVIKLPAPKDGDMIALSGLLELHVDPAGDYWTVLDPNYGEIELIGDKLKEFLEKTEKPDFSAVQAIGTVRKNGDERALDAMFINKQPAISLFGILGKQEKDAKTIWTLTLPDGLEYTLVGESLKELDTHPKYLGQALQFTGTFAKEHADVPLVGKAYLQVSQYSASSQNTLPLPTAIFATADALVVTRAGAVAVFDPTTLDVKVAADLFPPMPDLTPENGQLYLQERMRRIAPPLLTVADRNIQVNIGAELFSTGLDLQTIISATAPTGTPVLAGNAWFFMSNSWNTPGTDDALTVINFTDITQPFVLPLPKEMTARLYPTFQELQAIK